MPKDSEIVPFTKENAMKCICMQCPVQINSACSREKTEKLKKMMQRGQAETMPKPKDIPNIYCSGGAAACKDLDTQKMCICGSCPIWAEYNLATHKPMAYYCRDGKAK